MDKEQLPFMKNSPMPLDLFTPSGCISEMGFVDLLAGQLTPDQCQLLETHLGGCSPCRERAIELRSAFPRELAEEDFKEFEATPEEVERYLSLLLPDRRKPARARASTACPDTERWYDFKEGLISDTERVAMERHGAGCPSCSEVLRRLDWAAILL